MRKQLPDLRKAASSLQASCWVGPGLFRNRAGKEPELQVRFSACFLLIATSADKPHWKMATGLDLQKKATQVWGLKRGWWSSSLLKEASPTETLLTGSLSTAGLRENTNCKQNKTEEPRLYVYVLLEDYNFYLWFWCKDVCVGECK